MSSLAMPADRTQHKKSSTTAFHHSKTRAGREKAKAMTLRGTRNKSGQLAESCRAATGLVKRLELLQRLANGRRRWVHRELPESHLLSLELTPLDARITARRAADPRYSPSAPVLWRRSIPIAAFEDCGGTLNLRIPAAPCGKLPCLRRQHRTSGLAPTERGLGEEVAGLGVQL